MQCPVYECKTKPDRDEIELILKDKFKKFAHLERNKKIMMSKGALMPCPYLDCDGVIKNKKELFKKKGNKAKEECPDCK